jgi:hypothetical protein
MTKNNSSLSRTIVGIMGSHRDDSPCLAEADALGEAVARRGHVLLTGGGTGVMRAASKGAARAGGLVIGILPDSREDSRPGYPNEFVHVPVYTGMGYARNAINAKTPHVIIALAGSWGTLSEIALALNEGTPVITLGAPAIEPSPGAPLYPASSVEEALELLDRFLPPSNAATDGRDN